MNKKYMTNSVFIFGAALLASIFAYQLSPWSIKDSSLSELDNKTQIVTDGSRETAFENIGLSTNTAISSISLSDILGGGPPKDGIPAILEPTFITVDEASEWLDDEGLGIIYEHSGITRYYPYAILYWHEIVNDVIADKNIAVTFCPLCGSALIFDTKNDVFGVSGKLWESNLLMYDKKTETLWSQILGKAVVGDRTNEELEILNANIISFDEVKERHPNAEVLSKETGFRRSYGRSPYGDYEENNSLYFPVSSSDDAFHKKELFYLVTLGDKSIGFMRKDLIEAGSADLEVDGQKIHAEIIGKSEIKITNQSTNEQLPGYITMWFSWVTHIEKERVIWSK